MPEITIQSIYFPDRRVVLRRRTTIGRATDSDIFFPDQRLSRRHAVIQQRGEEFFIVDLGSTNGTYLNGERVARENRLRDGDVVSVGDSTITFHSGEEADSGEIKELLGVRTYSLSNMATRSTQRSLEAPDGVDQNRVLAVLSQASSALLQHHAIPELYDRILDVIQDALRAERGAILLVEPETGKPVVKASRSRDGSPPIRQVSSSLAQRVMDTQVTLLLQDVMADATLSRRESVISAGVRSVLCAPLWFRDNSGDPGKVLGIVYLDSNQKAASFTGGELQILTVLANVAAAKIENARLFEETVEKRRMEQDLRLAAEIQATLLPDTPPVVPGYNLAGATRSCWAVGGDYYDMVYTRGRLLFALGDVSGKGMSASMLMTALRAAVRAHWDDDALSFAEITGKINRTFNQCVPHDKYATLFLGRLDCDTGQLEYVNAGHNRPLLIRQGGAWESLSEGGTIIGAFEPERFISGRAELRDRDTLLVFSDGVSDTWTDPDAADRALIDLVEENARHGAHAVLKSIFRELDHKTHRGRANDDRTVIVLGRGET